MYRRCALYWSVLIHRACQRQKNKRTDVPYGKDPEGTMGKIIGMLKAKKFMTYSHENMIFVNPALIITEEQLREEMVKVDEVLTEVDSWLTI